MAKTIEEQFKEISKDGFVEETFVISLFDQLKPLKPEFMLGKWDGFPINTGHSFLEQSFKWAGKDFRSNDDIDPVMMWTEDGKRVWNSSFGHAQMREMKYRGVLTTGMVYDDMPMIDSFRYVDDNTVLCAVENKNVENNRAVWCYMKRL